MLERLVRSSGPVAGLSQTCFPTGVVIAGSKGSIPACCNDDGETECFQRSKISSRTLLSAFRLTSWTLERAVSEQAFAAMGETAM